MEVVNRAQVDAQLPLPTENSQVGELNGETLLPITTLLQGKTLVSEIKQGESAALT
jgi:hypothetical protein